MDFHNSLSDLDIFRKMTVCKTGFIFTHKLNLMNELVASFCKFICGVLGDVWLVDI